ncbi:MAG: NADH:ubiquinone reductase (Na(+)-transporting) subunit A [Flavobacteriaceae bacterium]|nr:NADH:ubiquinone reductase (Na(+)-transporting) subunit A [Flavobacteriaceae bacterium]|tara:strand:+ start:1116 stop:2468 length:1353 start_codon:yes stop_codon:yes gene_type:complete
MSTGIRIHKGASINLKGKAEKILSDAAPSKTYALKPDNFFSIVPRMMVKEGEYVAKGAPVFLSKNDPRIIFVSPVSGVVKEIVRGAKRKILKIVIDQKNNEAIAHKIPLTKSLDRKKVTEILLNSGAWSFIRQRPYGVLADPDITPKSIYVSSYTSAPLDVDFGFLLKNNKEDFQNGIDVLNHLADDQVKLAIDNSFSGFFEKIKGVEFLSINGPHPAGNVSVHIHKHNPINMGEKVWEVRPEDVANIGMLFSSGKFSAHRTVAVAGESVLQPQYLKTTIGAELSSLTDVSGYDNTVQNRFVNGDVLSGTAESSDGHLDYFNNLLSIIPEGDQYRMFGWLPFIDNAIPSLSKTSLSWLFNKKGYSVNTNMNGEERAFVVTGEMEKVFPMDIFPMQLLKACMAGDIEKMEALGIYEVIPEDFGLIDYANTSKIEAQEIIKEGIELMIKEVG